MTFRFDPRSFGIFLVVFVIEVAIALWLDDPFVRPLVGDTLVVILVFYFVRSFIQTRTRCSYSRRWRLPGRWNFRSIFAWWSGWVWPITGWR